MTRQRQAILEVLREAGRPLTFEEILQAGRQKIERLGPATVNRHLRDMAENFEVVGLQYPGQPKRYELPADKEHPHFICRACNKVFDLPVAMRVPEVEVPAGFQVMGGEVLYSGFCADCAKGDLG